MARCGGVRPRKKLKDAAAFWASGGDGSDKAREDLASFGASQAEIEQALGPKSEGFEVWEENFEVVRAFSAVQTQWSQGFAGPVGLDYTRVRDGLVLAGVEVTPDVFKGLQLMESVVLATLAKKARK